MEDFAPIIADTDRATCTFIVVKYEHTEDDGDLAGEPCITASSLRLAEWIAENTEAMFAPTDSAEYQRRP